MSVNKDSKKMVAEAKTVTLSVEDYQKLKTDSEMLFCLVGVGLTDWEGYKKALKIMEM